MKLSQSFILLLTLLGGAATGHYVQEEDPRSAHVVHHNDGRNQDRPHARTHNTHHDGRPRVGGKHDGPKLRGNSPETGEVRAGHQHGHDEPRAHHDDEHGNNMRTQHGTGHEHPRAGPGSSRSAQHDVLIIGAGVAGLSAARTLQEAGWTNYKILEAHPSHVGGRTMGSTHEFGPDINLDLGAEYIHTYTGKIGPNEQTYTDAYALLQEMVPWTTLSNDYRTKYTKQEPAQVCILSSNPERCMPYHDTPEYRWAGKMGWHTFVMEEVANTAVLDNVIKGCEVTAINRNADTGVVSATCGSTTYTAWSVIVTVPMSMLQKGKITFTPSNLVPTDYTTANQKWNVANGFKIWIEYNTKWYPEYSTRQDDLQVYQNVEHVDTFAKGNDAGYRLFWNEMYPYPNDNRAIIGGLIYGKPAEEYQGMSDEAIYEKIKDLLQTHAGGATPTGNWELMNWSTWPFVESAYTIWADDEAQWTMQQPIPSASNPSILFAGEAINYGWGFVHGAAETGRTQAQKVIAAG